MTPSNEDAWDRYAVTARALDQLRREAAAVVVGQQDAANAAQEQIAVVRQRVALQRSRFTDVSSRLSTPPPKLDPLEADRASVVGFASPPARNADPTAGISAALRNATATLDAADATLSSVADRPARAGLLGSWPPPARNAIVYLWYSVLAMIAIAEIDHIGGPSSQAGLVVAAFSIVAPLVAWAVAWLSVGVVFAADANGKRRRSAWLGLLICAIPLVVGLLLSGR
jgi:hypothetical protein